MVALQRDQRRGETPRGSEARDRRAAPDLADPARRELGWRDPNRRAPDGSQGRSCASRWSNSWPREGFLSPPGPRPAPAGSVDDRQVIVLDQVRLDQLTTLRRAQWRRDPAPADVAAIVERHLRQSRPSLASRRPRAVALAYGLLHDFGFAGALREIGPPQSDVQAALLSSTSASNSASSPSSPPASQPFERSAAPPPPRHRPAPRRPRHRHAGRDLGLRASERDVRLKDTAHERAAGVRDRAEELMCAGRDDACHVRTLRHLSSLAGSGGGACRIPRSAPVDPGRSGSAARPARAAGRRALRP